MKVKEVLFSVFKSLKNAIRAVAFLLLVAFLINIWVGWLKPKHFDGNLMMDAFYAQQENSVDVLVIGSSHTFVDVNTGTLWNEHGIPSFVIGGSLQPFWSSYYYLKEAVKTQTPKLVILEALACNIEEDNTFPGIIFNNVYGMRWGMEKLESIRASVFDTDGFVDYALFFEDYHNRYPELDMLDISGDLGDSVRQEYWKGFYDYFLIQDLSEPEFTEEVLPEPMVNKEEYYYRLILDFCQENDIPLLIMVSPDGGYTDRARAHYAYASEIADEYGVNFVDFNNYYDEIGLDFSYDFADLGHLNHFGNRKFTEYLGDYLTENYDLPDRRNDESGVYDSWDENYHYLENRFDNYVLSDTFDVNKYLGRLVTLSDEYEVFVTISDLTYITDEMRTYLGINGIPSARPYDERRWVIRGGNTTILYPDENGLYYEEIAGEHHLAISLDGTFFDGDDVFIELENQTGVEIVVYDTYNQTVADAVVIFGTEVWRL